MGSVSERSHSTGVDARLCQFRLNLLLGPSFRHRVPEPRVARAVIEYAQIDAIVEMIYGLGNPMRGQTDLS